MDDLATARMRPRRRFTVVGVVFILIGVLLLGWLLWQFVGSGIWARQQYARQIEALHGQWASEESPEGPAPGEAFAILTVPEFGEDFAVPVIAGTERDGMGRGVGAYVSSTPPGQIGNLAIAGYRTTHGAPFGRLLTLDQGAEVLIETRDAVYSYVLDVPAHEVTVANTDAWVLDPVPGAPEDDPTQPTLTLTTSQDLVRSPDRSVAFGHLGSTRVK